MTLMAELEPDETLAAIDSGEPTSAESLAWSEDDSPDETPVGSWRSVLMRAAAVLAFCVVAAVGVVVGWRERSTEATRTPPPIAATQTVPPPPTKEAVVSPSVVTTAMDSRAQKITPPPPPDRDTIYLDLLTKAGVTAPTKDKAISNGHLICKRLAEGPSVETVVTELIQVNPSLNHTQSDGAVHAAIDAYCPQHTDR